MNVSDILYQAGNFWVKKSAKGYEVYRVEATASIRCASIGYEGNMGFSRAKAEAERRNWLASKTAV